MNIKPIQTIPILNKIYKTPQNKIYMRGENKDVFIKSPSFSSTKKISTDDKSYTEFCNWVKKSGFLSEAADLTKNSKRIGEGFEGVLYEIPKTDKWVIKVDKRAWLYPINNSDGNVPDAEIFEIKDIVPDINIGQEIAYMKVPVSANRGTLYRVLKKQTGTSLGVEPAYASKASESSVKTHLTSLKLLSELPQKSFDDLIANIKYLNSKNIILDCCNPNNFMLDEKNKSINIVDTSETKQKINSQLGSALYTLLDGEFQCFMESNDYSKEKIEESKKLSDKVIQKYLQGMKNNSFLFDNTRDYFGILLSFGSLDKYSGCGTKDEKLQNLNNYILNRK